MGARGVGLLWSYGHGKTAIIVGSTGGGVSLGGMDQAALTWDELARDLRLAARLADDVGIFSLEGCVRQRFLERLRDFDWDGPVAHPTAEAAMIGRWRAVARAFLWITARPCVLLALPGLALALRWSRHRSARGGPA
jgi:hypothetical protein